MSIEKEWYVYRGHQRWGPYQWNQLLEMAQRGQINPKDQLWHPHYPNLVYANQVQGLFKGTNNTQPFGCSDIIAIFVCIFLPSPAIFMAIMYLIRRDTVRGAIYLGLSLLFSCIWLVILASLGLLGN